MAVADALQLVLEADVTNYEQGMEKAEQSTQDFKKEQDSAAFQNQVTLASLEAMTSGLNGLVGGYSKTINAAKDLNMVNEAQYESLLRSQKQLELLVGPLELVISGFKIFNAVLLMNPIILIVAGIAILILGLVYLEMKTQFASNAFKEMATTVRMMSVWVGGLSDGLDGLVSKFEIIGDIGDKLTGYVGSIT
mgnify:CR=1 FL=1|tara:strand:+ start:636 stop:1214 length:579 start_codon:yes stop_codon:yes gene_type:complete